MNHLELGEYPARVLHLMAFSLAPGWLSPDPAPASAGREALALVALVALAAAAIRFGGRLESKLAKAAAAMTVATIVAALAGVGWSSSAGTPLGRAAVYVAPLWWLTLALAAAAAAHRLLVPSVRRQAAVVIGILVALGGGVQLLQARPMLTSDEHMWRRAIELEPAHDDALEHLSASLAARGDHQQLLSLAEQCVVADRRRCGCHAIRSFALSRLRRADEASTLTRAALDFCRDDALLRASHAHALALTGHHAEALAEAGRGFEELAADGRPHPLVESELRHARALGYQGTGQTQQALAEAEAAIEAGGGRDARLLAAAIAIDAGELDRAAKHVDLLLDAHPDDADGLYNRALIAHRRDDFNAAREGYLATLRRAPDYAAARYNLAVLTWYRGVKPEARHHAALFLRDFPSDPRGATLKALTQGGEDEPAPTWVGKPRPADGVGGGSGAGGGETQPKAEGGRETGQP